MLDATCESCETSVRKYVLLCVHHSSLTRVRAALLSPVVGQSDFARLGQPPPRSGHRVLPIFPFAPVGITEIVFLVRSIPIFGPKLRVRKIARPKQACVPKRFR
jgi:hypothetical protein